MSTENDPVAQGPQDGAAVPSNEANPQPQGGTNEGIERRIGQLTAARYDAERRAAELQGRYEALQQVVMQQSQQPAPQPADPWANLPEEHREVARAVVPQLNQQWERRMQQMDARYRQELGALQLQAAVATQPPQVQQLASQLYQDWQRTGRTGWTPQDAVIYARGHLGIPSQQPAAPQPPADPFATPTYRPLPNSTPPPPAAARGAPQQPPDMESDPAGAAAYWERQLDGKTW